VALQPGRLPLLRVGLQSEPCEVGADRLHEPLLAPLRIGVVDPQQEAPALLFCEQPVVERRADIAHMEQPGGGWGETGGDRHGAPLARAACYCENSVTERPLPESSRPPSSVRWAMDIWSSASPSWVSSGGTTTSHTAMVPSACRSGPKSGLRTRFSRPSCAMPIVQTKPAQTGSNESTCPSIDSAIPNSASSGASSMPATRYSP